MDLHYHITDDLSSLQIFWAWQGTLIFSLQLSVKAFVHGANELWNISITVASPSLRQCLSWHLCSACWFRPGSPSQDAPPLSTPTALEEQVNPSQTNQQKRALILPLIHHLVHLALSFLKSCWELESELDPLQTLWSWIIHLASPRLSFLTEEQK